MEDFGKLIYRIKTGSSLYGLQTPESDVDYVGVFIPKTDYLLGLKTVDEVDNSTKNSKADRRNISDDVDDKTYALPKFLHLLIQNNPNIVEMLFPTPEVIDTLKPEFQELIDNRDKIVSQKVFHTFTGYAFSQKKKLTVKSERYKSLVVAIEAIENSFHPSDLKDSKRAIFEEEAIIFNKILKYYKGQKGNTESFHKGMPLKTIYEKLVEERDNYGWRVKTDTFETLGYDVKFGYHLIRILAEGYQLLKTGKLSFPISGQVREDIVRIRAGEVNIKELLQIYDSYDILCKQALKTTQLPKTPDWKWANKYLIKTLKNSILNEESP